jgi:flavin-dependent dehydrogenase
MVSVSGEKAGTSPAVHRHLHLVFHGSHMSPTKDRSSLAIAGAGVAGAYLYKLLSREGIHIDVYDIRHKTRCGVSPCAWATSEGFIGLIEAVGFDPGKYILQPIDHVTVGEMKVRVEVMTIDKPSLVKDLLGGADIHFSPLDVKKYDRVIDATGFSRTFLPTIKKDIISSCIQYCVQKNGPIEARVEPGGIGYAWCFHLSENRYHIGCGSLAEKPFQVLKDLGWLEIYNLNPGRNILCGCTGKIRITGPKESQPFVTNGAVAGVWGVGEAIGCVGSIVGDGIVPGMKSAQILIDNWDSPDRYRESILKEFGWIDDERRVIDKLRKRKPLNVGDALVIKNNSKRIGINIGLAQAAIFMKRLRLS